MVSLISLQVALLLARKADLEELRDPGGKRTARFDVCPYCHGTGNGMSKESCTMCNGDGVTPLLPKKAQGRKKTRK